MSDIAGQSLLFLGRDLNNHIEASSIPKKGDIIDLFLFEKSALNGFYKITSMDEIEFEGTMHHRISSIKRVKNSSSYLDKDDIRKLDFTKVTPMGDVA